MLNRFKWILIQQSWLSNLIQVLILLFKILLLKEKLHWQRQLVQHWLFRQNYQNNPEPSILSCKLPWQDPQGNGDLSSFYNLGELITLLVQLAYCYLYVKVREDFCALSQSFFYCQIHNYHYLYCLGYSIPHSNSFISLPLRIHWGTH